MQNKKKGPNFAGTNKGASNKTSTSYDSQSSSYTQDYATTIERARSALNHLDSNCTHDEWIKIGMAAKSAGLDFEDFHLWSKNAGNYKGEKDCKSAWNSFNDRGKIKAATLFYEALKNGWQDPKKFRGSKSNSANKQVHDIWESCVPALPSHEYIFRKQGETEGVRVYPSSAAPLLILRTNVVGYLVVPCLSKDKLQTLQFIPPNEGEKLNFPGAKFNDGYFTVGNVTNVIYISEGISHGWAIYRARGFAAVVCFSAGRMMAVAKALRAEYPNARLVVVPDRGQEELASKIALAVSGHWVELPSDKDSNYDVNDFAQEFGYEALANLLADIKTPEMHYKLLSSSDLMNFPPMRWMIHGVLPSEGLAALYGPSGSGKSFLTLDMACAIASGSKDWFGRRVTQVPVVYVCLEGEAGVSKRIKAWVLHFKKGLPDALRFIAQPFDLLSGDVLELAKTLIASECVGGLVIIDTLNRAAPGADENSSVDMGNIIAAAKQLQIQIGGLVLLVHHTGKDATKGLRGHSSLYASLDGAIEVVKANAYREWSVAKSKDDVTGDAHSFNLKVIQVSFDDENEEITSCVVVPDDGVNNMRHRIIPPKSGNLKIIWDALSNLFFDTTHFGQGGAPAGTPCIRLDEAIEKTRTRLVCPEKRRTERTQAAVTALITKGLLRHQDGWLWLI
jgi:putative DNA primase/helicase